MDNVLKSLVKKLTTHQKTDKTQVIKTTVTLSMLISTMFILNFVVNTNSQPQAEIDLHTNIPLACEIKGNKAGREGGGIYSGGSLDLDDKVIISNNEAVIYGGGIRAYGKLTLNNTQVDNNKAQNGGGLCIQGTFKLTGNTVIKNNVANDNGGGILVFSTVDKTSALLDNDVIVELNNAKHGGGIFLSDGTLNILKATIKNNTSTLHGGGIHGSGNSTLNLTNTIIESNKGSNGGGINLFGDTPTLNADNITLSYNEADSFGGGIMVDNTGPDEAPTGSSIATITNSTITNNLAYCGGGIENQGKLTLDTVTVTNNTSGGDGGAIHNYLEYADLTATDCNFDYNKSKGSGGAISNVESLNLVLNNSTCSFNKTYETEWGPDGGGIWNDRATLTMNSCRMEGNESISEGRALYNMSGTAILNNTIIQNHIKNDTLSDGSDIFGTLIRNNKSSLVDYGSVMELNGCTIQNNKAKDYLLLDSHQSELSINNTNIINNDLYGSIMLYLVGGDINIDSSLIDNNINTNTADTTYNKYLIRGSNAGSTDENGNYIVKSALDLDISGTTISNNAYAKTSSLIEIGGGTLDIVDSIIYKNESYKDIDNYVHPLIRATVYGSTVDGVWTPSQYCTATINNCDISHNKAVDVIYSNAKLTVIDSEIHNNESRTFDLRSASVDNFCKMETIIDNTLIHDNSTTQGIIYCNSSFAADVDISNSKIYNNDAQVGSSIIASGAKLVTTLDSCEIYENTATTRAGLYADAGTMNIIDTKVYDNVAPANTGAGMFTRGGTVNINGSTEFTPDNTNNEVYLSKDTDLLTVNGELTESQVARITPNSYTNGRTVVRTAYPEDDMTLASEVISKFSLTPSTTNTDAVLRAGDLIDDSYNILDTDVIISTGYTVTYDENRLNDKEDVENMPEAQTKHWGESLTLSDKVPTWGRNEFLGWNTAADGSGTEYQPGDVYTADESVTLYAQWKLAAITITYKSNGVEGEDITDLWYIGEEYRVKTNPYEREGYTFVGWSEDPNFDVYGDEEVDFTENQLVPAEVTATRTEDFTLYAIWKVDYSLSLKAIRVLDPSSMDSATQFRRGEAAVLMIRTTGFVDTLEISFPTLDDYDSTLNTTLTITPQLVSDTEYEFIIPLYAYDGSHPIVVTAYDSAEPRKGELTDSISIILEDIILDDYQTILK